MAFRLRHERKSAGVRGRRCSALTATRVQGNLYVGIKKTGGFQHSSFLYGARVTAAGLIKVGLTCAARLPSALADSRRCSAPQVDKGKLTSLSPLSGHYRAGTMHFKAFVRSLQERKVDMGS